MEKGQKIQKNITEKGQNMQDTILSQIAYVCTWTPYHHFLYGIWITCTAATQAICIPDIRSSYQSRLKYIMIFAAVIYLLGMIVIIPLRIGLFIMNFLFQQAWAITNWDEIVYGAIAGVAFLATTGVRYCDPAFFERTFFATLRYHDPLYADTLQKKKNHWMQAALMRYWKYLVTSLTMGTLYTFIPLMLPIFVPIFAIFRFGYSVKRFNWIFFAVLMTLYIPVSSRHVATMILKWWLDARCLLREFLDPFLGRTPDVHFSHLFRNNQALFMGIYFPFAIASHYVLLQPVVWIIGFAVGGELTYRLQDKKLHKSIFSFSQ